MVVLFWKDIGIDNAGYCLVCHLWQVGAVIWPDEPEKLWLYYTTKQADY